MTSILHPIPGFGKRSERICSVILFTILIAGFAVRLAFLPDARFTGDEALFYEEASRAAAGEWLPWIGPAVTDGPLHHPGGTFYLLMALPLTVTRSPLGPMALVALLNILAYGLIYCIFARRSGPSVGLLVLALLVFSPWSFFYSDRIWNSNLVLPLAAAFLWALLRVLDTPRARHLGVAVFALTLMPQFHLSVVLLAALMFLLLVLYRPQLHMKSAALGLGCGLLFYLPYLVHELRTGFANSRLLLSRSSETAAGGEVVQSLLGFFTLGSLEMSYFAERGFWFPHDLARYYGDGPGLSGLFGFFGGGLAAYALLTMILASIALALTGFCLLVFRTIRAPRSVFGDPLLMACLVSLPILALAFWLSRRPFFPHYIYPLYPLSFVFPATALGALLPREGSIAGRWRSRGAITLVSAIAISGVCISAHYYRTVDGLVGVRSSTEMVETILSLRTELDPLAPISVSFDVEMSRLGPGPLLRLARRRFHQPLPYDPHASLRFKIFSPGRWAAFQEREENRRRIDGTPVQGSRTLRKVVVAWTCRFSLAN